MTRANVMESQIAHLCGVDPKTVSRWVASSVRAPHARHRAAISRVLGEEEAVLWPSVRQFVKSGPDRELVQMYPYRSSAPMSLWRQLISRAENELTFAATPTTSCGWSRPASENCYAGRPPGAAGSGSSSAP